MAWSIGNTSSVLGDIVVGDNSRVGAGSVVLRDVPPNSTVVGVPAHIVYRDGKRVLITDPREIKDPLSDALIALSKDVSELRSRLDKLAHLAVEEAAGRMVPWLAWPMRTRSAATIAASSIRADLPITAPEFNRSEPAS